MNKYIDINKLTKEYIHKQKNGSYRVEISLGYNNLNGKRERFVKRVSTKEEAIRIRNEKIQEMNKGALTPNSRISFTLLTKEFLIYNKDMLEDSTLETYRRSLNNYILPFIGEICVGDIKEEHLRDLYKYLKDSYPSKNRVGISNVTMGHVHATIRAILNFGKKKSYINDNIASHIKRAPNLQSENPRQAYTIEEVNSILLYLKKENLRFQSIIEIALSGSLRRGEISGLNWGDIDFKNKKVNIERSSTVIKGKGVILKEPKTQNSKSKISISQDTVDALLKYRTELELLGFTITNDTPTFLTINGTRLSPNKISKYWRDFVLKHDLPQYCFHSLRHTSLSIMYLASKNIVAVSKHARHSKVSTTSDIYLHSNDKQDEELIYLFESALTSFTNL